MRDRTRPDDIDNDDSYYFEDAIFLVEKTRFKIPRHLFEQESPTFCKMFSSSLDQSTQDDPLLLKGVSKTDFVAFLKLICPKNLSQREELSSKDWESVLKLSTMWGFDESRARAIENLALTTAAADPIQMILLAKEHNVPQWYSSNLKQLVERQDPLTVDEVNRLGLELGLKVAQMRGKVEGFKIAESRFNQAVHSMTTAFTYMDFWDTVVDDSLPGTISRAPTPRSPREIPSARLSPTPSILLGSPHSPFHPDPPCMPASLSPETPPPCFPIASPKPAYSESKAFSEYDLVCEPRTPLRSPASPSWEVAPSACDQPQSSTPHAFGADGWGGPGAAAQPAESVGNRDKLSGSNRRKRGSNPKK